MSNVPPRRSRPVVRPATRADHPTFVRLFPELGVDDPVADEARWMRDFVPHSVFAEEAGVPLGVLFGHVLGDTGYVRMIIVSPEARGRGVGRLLMDHARVDFRARGCTRWCLNVKEENTAARALYEKCGMTTRYVSTKMRLRWDALPRLPASPPTLTVREVDPSEDAAVERAIDMPPGWFAQSREQNLHVFLRVIDSARPGDARVGFARFTPSFPGSFPFAVEDPAFARVLLETMKTRALAGQEAVNLIVENNALVTRALLAAGAEHGFDMLHLRGEL